MDAQRVRPDLDTIIAGLRALDERRRYHKIDYFEPYPKQEAFFALGATKRERLLRAGNQLGKTYAGAAELTFHLTGEYPWWWTGRRFNHPVKAWVCGEGGLQVRDGPQTILCGQPGVEEAFGTGLIPRDKFVGYPTASRGVASAFDTMQIRHVSGGISSVTFKSYEQGREKFQGATLDIVWCDEEPDEEIYSECLARISATGGLIYITFTPLKGFSRVVIRFLREKSEDRSDTQMTLEDALHMTPEKRKQILASYRPHELDARTRGDPLLGSGAVWEDVKLTSLLVPLRLVGRNVVHDTIGVVETRAWNFLWGIDFGIAHPFAAALLGWDKDSDRIFVLAELKITGGVPAIHASRMKAIAAGVKVAWPQDGTARDKGSGDKLAKLYADEGLLMLPEHATHPDGGVGTEAGVMDMLARMRSDRFAVAQGCIEWQQEFSSYYREKGLIVKQNDDLMSATRVGVMQIRSARHAALGAEKILLKPTGKTEVAKDVDFDVFNT